MAKSLFTTIFLIVSLVIADGIQTFVKNNRPPKEPEVVTDVEATTTNAYDDYINNSSSFDDFYNIE
jgi:hypothetical protein